MFAFMPTHSSMNLLMLQLQHYLYRTHILLRSHAHLSCSLKKVVIILEMLLRSMQCSSNPLYTTTTKIIQLFAEKREPISDDWSAVNHRLLRETVNGLRSHSHLWSPRGWCSAVECATALSVTCCNNNHDAEWIMLWWYQTFFYSSYVGF